jgi:tripartite-type tricarboxylate transporter receptor subunit TctC
MQTRRSFLEKAVAGAVAGTAIAPSARAGADYPARPVQVWVGFPGGGALDVATRIVTQAMADAGIKPIVVMNKAGASATIAAAQVARQEPDGYNLLLATSSNVGIAPFLYPRLPFDGARDFDPVAQFAVGQNVIYASPRTGVSSFQALVARLRAQPGKLNFASPGRGTTPHLCFEILKARAGLFVVHVPFHGSPAALTAVAGGEVEFGVDAIGPSQAFIRAGRLVALAQTGERRSASLPDVPTLSELGYPGIPRGTFLGFSAPSGTPAAVLEQLRKAVRAATANPVVVKQLADAGFDASYLDGADFAQAIRGELRTWEAAVKYSGAART